MGQCVEKLGHSCGSSDGLQVFENEGKYDGYCFACGESVPNPYGEGGQPSKPFERKTVEDRERERDAITDYPSLAIPSRHLSADTLSYFNVKVGVSLRDGETPETVYFPLTREGDLIKYKARLLEPKKFWAIGRQDKDIDFFGWEQAINTGSKKVFITEGEFDTLASYQICKEKNRGTKWEVLDPAVISVPNGAGSADEFISARIDELRRQFKDIVLVFDQDEPGQKAAASICRTYPDIQNATLPAKDANQCLIDGRVKAAYAAIMFKAEKPKNTRIIYGSELVERAKVRPEMGLSWPWQGLTAATRGIRRGTTIYFGAGVKMGKSELVNALGKHLIVDHNLPVFFVKPEEDVAKTYKLLVGKAVGKVFHDPNIPFDEEAFDEGSAMIGDKALIQDVYQFVDWNTLKQDIIYAVKNDGVKDVIIDPITCFTNQMGSAEANEYLMSMSADLSACAKDLDFTAYIFCHLKAPANGEPHERGGRVFSTQFAGSRAMMRSCNYMIGLEGNKDPELDEIERNMRSLVILEDREYGTSERINLFWDKNTGLFNEIRH